MDILSAEVRRRPSKSEWRVSNTASKIRHEYWPLLAFGLLTPMLTDTKIRSLKPTSAVYRVADTNGLCIEMRPAGSKMLISTEN